MLTVLKAGYIEVGLFTTVDPIVINEYAGVVHLSIRAIRVYLTLSNLTSFAILRKIKFRGG